MSTPDRGRRRPRRLASDEAHAWARNLRLNKNVEAKLLLMMLALYVDSNGCAFVGIPTLAEDAELSAQTIRRRLAWLEEIGAIARVPQWIDSGGRRNGDENGKRTSDLIMFLYGADPDIIERRACGEVCAPVSPIYQIGLNRADADVSDSQDGQECGDAAGVDSDVSRAPISPSSQQGLQTGVLQGGEGVAAPNAVSPIQQIGLNPSFSPSSQRGLNPVSPTPALRQPYHCGKGLISEPEPESTPNPPSRGREVASLSSESEPEHFGPAWQLWPTREVGRRDLALDEFCMLTPDQQVLCRAAIPLYLAAKKRLGETHFPRLHVWIRTRGFENFPDAKLGHDPVAPPPDHHWIDEGSELDRALRFVRQLAKAPSPFVRSRADGARGYFVKAPIGKDMLAMLQFEHQSPLRWPTYARGTPQHAAWQQRFVSWVGQGLPLDPRGDVIHAPCEWPPRKDGTFFEGNAGEPQQEGGNDSAA